MASSDEWDEIRSGQPWWTISRAATSTDVPSIGLYSPGIEPVRADADETVLLASMRESLAAKTLAVETLRAMLLRAEECHRASIAGLSKCISHQQQIINQNASTITALREHLAKSFEDDDKNGQDESASKKTRTDAVHAAKGEYYIDVADLDADLDDL